MVTKSIVTNRRLNILFFLVSFVALLAQVIFMRQSLLLFEQSEYVISIFLFFWLAGNGLGVYCGKIRKITEKHFAVSVYVYGVIILIFYYGLHFIRPLLLSVKTTESLFVGVFFTALCIVIPSFYNGWLFSQFVSFKRKSQPVLKLYKIEALAFFLAGSAATVVVYLFSDFYLMAGALIILFIFILVDKINITSIIFTLLLPALLILNPLVQKQTWHKLFPDYKYQKSIQMPSGQMDILKSQRSGELLRLFQGSPVNMAKPPAAPEEAFYPGLSQIKSTKPEILIAGDDMLPLLEALHYSDIHKADILIQDPVYFEELSKGFIKPVREMLNEKGIEVIHASLQNHLRENIGTYDLIFISEQRPSLMENALLYFPDNIQLMKKALTNQGVLSLLFSSEAAYAGRVSRVMKGSVYNCINQIFNAADILALDNYTVLLASEKRLSVSANKMEQALYQRDIHPMYFNEFNVGTRIENAGDIGVDAMKNYDGTLSFNKPVIYMAGLLNMIENYSVNNATAVMQSAEKVYARITYWQAGSIIILSLLFCLLMRHSRGGGIVFHAGFTGIAAQMMFIYLYQLHFGNIYLLIGLLVALFMVGLVVGLMIKPQFLKKAVPFIVLLLIITLLISLFLFRVRMIAVAGIFLSGFYTGITFALNSAITGQQERNSGITLYINDLMGGLFGNLLIPLVFIPFLGFYMPLALFLATGIITVWYQRKLPLA